MADRDAKLHSIFEIARTACETVASTRNLRSSGIDPMKWGELVDAVTNYCGLIDQEAAERNRDEHGPDIPDQEPEWRNRL